MEVFKAVWDLLHTSGGMLILLVLAAKIVKKTFA